MAFDISIGKEVPKMKISNEEKKILILILNEMRNRQTRGLELHDTYGKYLPSLLPFSDRVRGLMSHSLLALWEYCYDNEIPQLNFLLKRADTNEPGAGVQEWYEKKFLTLTDFDKYCDLQANLAKMSLVSGIVRILP